MDDLVDLLGFEGDSTEDQDVEDDSERENIDFLIILLRLEDLGCYETCCATFLIGLFVLRVDEVRHEEVRQADICEILRASKDYVLQFYIPMKNLSRMHVLESGE